MNIHISLDLDEMTYFIVWPPELKMKKKTTTKDKKNTQTSPTFTGYTAGGISIIFIEYNSDQYQILLCVSLPRSALLYKTAAIALTGSHNVNLLELQRVIRTDPSCAYCRYVQLYVTKWPSELNIAKTVRLSQVKLLTGFVRNST
jgi:predicted nucleic-acid-binding Zn-ribbon protein